MTMKDELCAIFTKNLPSVSSSTAEEFADGMQAYYKAFKARQDSDMNYNAAPDYHSEFNHIMAVAREDYWMHSPQFRKILGLAIGKLFKTKITMFSTQNTVDISYSILFVDAHFNRWSVSFLMQSSPEADHPDSEGSSFRICARFPISDTKVQHFLKITEEEISDPAFNKKEIGICVHDASMWHDGGDDDDDDQGDAATIK
jgi:hypothetical protein